ncbi:CsiV family protein [Rheinheimera maricola]|uniref:Peptidoglycan binding protein CsiV n=1 Tax=Rheinheimera maricola TaxID=2793282 RepID=A0ABS7X774_9GAMM|nr:CsiV family protein [Rheinheimera maricola]MBZ9610647.1 peptidoglycan binding protein CsiV [Rheinheimera maricola]
MINALKYSLLGAMLVIETAAAQEQRWFEIELIMFRQTPGAATNEVFSDAVKPIKPGRSYDLLTARYQPDLTSLLAALPLCPTQATPALVFQLMPIPAQSMCIFEPQPAPWQQQSLFQPLHAMSKVPFPSELPSTIVGQEQHNNQPYLAPYDALQLTDIAKKINRLPGKTLLLHTSWRQVPVTERRAIASRWYGGKNFSQQFDYWGQPTMPATAEIITQPNSDTRSEFDDTPNTEKASTHIMQQIDELLYQLNANPQLVTENDEVLATIIPEQLSSIALPNQVWQFDGLFKLHLDHYLFVNTEFNLRVPNADQLDTVHVRQSRRVISGEVHYLDHPHLGMVLQIRRFEPPMPADTTPAEPAQVLN